MAVSREEVATAITGILEEMSEDWDLDTEDPISEQTKLVGELGFSSIDFVEFAVAMEERFDKPRLGFDEVLIDRGKAVEDLTVGQVVNFVFRKLNGG